MVFGMPAKIDLWSATSWFHAQHYWHNLEQSLDARIPGYGFTGVERDIFLEAFRIHHANGRTPLALWKLSFCTMQAVFVQPFEAAHAALRAAQEGFESSGMIRLYLDLNNDSAEAAIKSLEITIDSIRPPPKSSWGSINRAADERRTLAEVRALNLTLEQMYSGQKHLLKCYQGSGGD